MTRTAMWSNNHTTVFVSKTIVPQFITHYCDEECYYECHPDESKYLSKFYNHGYVLLDKHSKEEAQMKEEMIKQINEKFESTHENFQALRDLNPSPNAQLQINLLQCQAALYVSKAIRAVEDDTNLTAQMKEEIVLGSQTASLKAVDMGIKLADFSDDACKNMDNNPVTYCTTEIPRLCGILNEYQNYVARLTMSLARRYQTADRMTAEEFAQMKQETIDMDVELYQVHNYLFNGVVAQMKQEEDRAWSGVLAQEAIIEGVNQNINNLSDITLDSPKVQYYNRIIAEADEIKMRLYDVIDEAGDVIQEEMMKGRKRNDELIAQMFSWRGPKNEKNKADDIIIEDKSQAADTEKKAWNFFPTIPIKVDVEASTKRSMEKLTDAIDSVSSFFKTGTSYMKKMLQDVITDSATSGYVDIILSVIIGLINTCNAIGTASKAMHVAQLLLQFGLGITDAVISLATRFFLFVASKTIRRRDEVAQLEPEDEEKETVGIFRSIWNTMIDTVTYMIPKGVSIPRKEYEEHSNIWAYAKKLVVVKNVMQAVTYVVEFIYKGFLWLYNKIFGEPFFTEENRILINDCKAWMLKTQEILKDFKITNLANDMHLCKYMIEHYEKSQELSAETIKRGYNSGNYQAFFKMISDFKQIYEQAKQLTDNRDKRIAPVLVELSGNIGAGKSYCMDLITVDLYNAYCKRKGIPFTSAPSAIRYEWSPHEEFQEAYYNQFCVSMDDVWQHADSVIRTEKAVDLVRMCSNAPYPVPKANLSGKGNVFFDSHIILMSSNTMKVTNDGQVRCEDIKLDMQDDKALKRRREFFVAVDVQEGYYNWQFTKEGKRKKVKKDLTPAQVRKAFKFMLIHPETEKPMSNMWIGYQELLDRIDGAMRRQITVKNTLAEALSSDNCYMPDGTKYEVAQMRNEFDNDMNHQSDCKALTSNGRVCHMIKGGKEVALEGDRVYYKGMLAYKVKGQDEYIFLKDIRDFVPQCTCNQYKDSVDSILSTIEDVMIPKEKKHEMKPVWKVLIGSLGAICAVYGLYKMYNWLTKEEEEAQGMPGNVHDVGVSKGARVTKVTKKKLFKAPQYAQMDEMAYDVAVHVLLQNMTNITITDRYGRKYSTQMLFTAGRVGVTVQHIISLLWNEQSKDWVGKLELFEYRTGEMKISMFDCSELRFFCSDEYDKVHILFPLRLQPYRNIIKHIISADDLEKANISRGFVVTRHKGEQPAFKTCMSIKRWGGEVNYKMKWDGKVRELIMANVLRYLMASTVGDCGGVLLTENTHIISKVMGIHAFGSEEMQTGGSFPLTKEAEQDFLDRLNNLDAQMSTEDLIDYNKEQRPTFIYPEKAIQFVGKLKNEFVHRLPSDTDIVPSLIHGEITEAITAPAMLKPTGNISPMQNVINKFNEENKVFKLPKHVLQELAEAIVDRVGEHVPERVLETWEAINGVAAFQFFGGLHMSSADGFTYFKIKPLKGQKGKEHLFIKIGESFYEAKPELQDRMDELESLYKQGKYGQMIIEGNLKDERRVLEKVLLGKTRLFCCCETAHTILLRKYLGTFIENLLCSRETTGITLGINPHDPREWEWVTKGHRFQNPLFRQHDIGGADINRIREFTEALNEAVIKRHVDKGIFSEEEAMIVRGLLADISTHMTMILFDDLVKMINVNFASGAAVTAPFVSLYFELIDRACLWVAGQEMNAWIKDPSLFNYEQRANQKMDHTKPMLIPLTVYDVFEYMENRHNGDDTVNIQDKDLWWYTGHYFKNILANWGVEVTSPTKSGELKNFYREDEIEFLKRGRRYERGMCRAPLNKETLLEILNWVNNRHDPMEALEENVLFVVEELAYHEQEVWDEYYPKICEAMRSIGSTKRWPSRHDVLLKRDLELQYAGEEEAQMEEEKSDVPKSNNEDLADKIEEVKQKKQQLKAVEEKLKPRMDEILERFAKYDDSQASRMTYGDQIAWRKYALPPHIAVQTDPEEYVPGCFCSKHGLIYRQIQEWLSSVYTAPNIEKKTYYVPWAWEGTVRPKGSPHTSQNNSYRAPCACQAVRWLHYSSLNPFGGWLYTIDLIWDGGERNLTTEIQCSWYGFEIKKPCKTMSGWKNTKGFLNETFFSHFLRQMIEDCGWGKPLLAHKETGRMIACRPERYFDLPIRDFSSHWLNILIIPNMANYARFTTGFDTTDEEWVRHSVAEKILMKTVLGAAKLFLKKDEKHELPSFWTFNQIYQHDAFKHEKKDPNVGAWEKFILQEWDEVAQMQEDTTPSFTKETGWTTLVDTKPAEEPDADTQYVHFYRKVDPFKDRGLSNILTNQYRINTFTWTGASVAGALIGSIVSPGDLLNISTLLTEKINHFHWFRANTRIKIVVNGTIFHSGALLVGWLPFCKNLNESEFTNIYTMSSLDCAIVSPDSNRPVEFVIPYRGMPSHWTHDMTNDEGYFGTAVIRVLAPLQLTGATATPSLEVSVFANFERAELMGPTLHSNASLKNRKKAQGKELEQEGIFTMLDPDLEEVAQMEQAMQNAQDELTVVNAEQQRKSSGGVLTKALQIGSGVVSSLSVWPGWTLPALAGGALLRGASYLTRYFGFNKPNSVATFDPVYLSTVNSMAQGDGLNVLNEISMSSNNQISHSKADYGLSQDEHMISFLISRPGCFYVGSFTSAAVAGEVIYTWHNTPMLSYARHDSVTLTDQADLIPCAVIGLNFSQWRGAMKYAIYFVCPKTVSFRVRISWHPTYDEIPADFTTGEGDFISEVYDICNDQWICFTIPYCKEIPMAQCYPPWVSPRPEKSYAGGLCISLVTSVPAVQSTTQTIHYSVWASAHPAMDFQLPYTRDLTSDGYGIADVYDSNAAFSGALVAQMLEEEAQMQQCNCPQDLFKSEFPMLNQAAYSDMNKVVSGERVSSVLELFHRFNWHSSISLANNEKQVIKWPEQEPLNSMPYALPFQLCQKWSKFARGGLLYKFVPGSNTTIGVDGTMIATITQTGSNISNMYTTINGMVLENFHYKPALELSLPYYSNFPYFTRTTTYPTEYRTGVNVDSDVSLDIIWRGIGTAAETAFDVFYAVKDDFSLAYFRGAPRVITTAQNPAPKLERARIDKDNNNVQKLSSPDHTRIKTGGNQPVKTTNLKK